MFPSRIIIIGMDGLDPDLLLAYIKHDLLPNFKSLAKTYFSKLVTTTPPQSPVAWASFITGQPPCKHQIFDFIKRDPLTYLPRLTFSHAAQTSNPMKAIPFWQKSTDQGIPTSVLFLPNTFPLPKNSSPLLTMISGMGTPCLDGTESTCHFFYTKTAPKETRSYLVKVENKKSTTAHILGPKKGLTPLSIPLGIKRSKNSLTLSVQNQKIVLKPDQISSWIKLDFRLNFLVTLHGIAYFYLKSLYPLELYLSPINFSPFSPPFPISYPNNFSRVLAEKFGLYHTLGLPSDTWALENDFLTSKAFLKIAYQIIDDAEQIFFNQLEGFKQGLFVGYFNSTDPIQHMFLGHNNQQHNPSQKVIQEVYQRMDSFLGKLKRYLKPTDQLIILSDHGFKAFDYEVNLNTVLKENKFFALNKKAKENPLLKNTDWSKTTAYALGFNSLYLNLKGREANGIVSEDDYRKTLIKVSKVLKSLRYQGKPVIKNLYTRKDLGISKDLDAPDLVVGYYQGFRASWKTAIGDLAQVSIEKRAGKWSGDHLFDASEVPGILLSNRKISLINPRIENITPLALKLLGVT